MTERNFSQRSGDRPDEPPSGATPLRGPLRVYWSPLFDFAVARDRRFPHRKYRLLREALLREGILDETMLLKSPLAAREDLCRAHSPDYVDAVLTGTLDEKMLRRIGFAASDQLADRSRASVGGSLCAARSALASGLSGQLAGGTHHAHADFGSGYCVFNDHAVTALALLAEDAVTRVAVLDLDVHQGDGNSAILGSDPRVFVASVHGEKNFPFRKVAGDLDIALPDQADDATYLAACARALAATLAFAPDIVLYQAGVDALELDQLGRLAVTLPGLARRDTLVLGELARAGVPVSMAIGGGYGDPIEVSVAAYAQTWQIARAVFPTTQNN